MAACIVSEQVEIQTPLEALFEKLGNYTAVLSEEQVREALLLLTSFKDSICGFEQFDPVTYRRNRLFRSEFLDILLLCWRPGQRSPIHDHAGSICGVSVLRGESTEIKFTSSGLGMLIPNGSEVNRPGGLMVSSDTDIHVMGNFSGTGEDLVTLHCYSPPLGKMKLYEPEDTFMADYSTVVQNSKQSGCFDIRRPD